MEVIYLISFIFLKSKDSHLRHYNDFINIAVVNFHNKGGWILALGQHIAAKTLLTGGGGELHDYIIYMMGFFIVMTCNILCIGLHDN